jgi:hypothetical protein
MCMKGLNDSFRENSQWDGCNVRLASSPLGFAVAPLWPTHTNWMKTDEQTVIFAL